MKNVVLTTIAVLALGAAALIITNSLKGQDTGEGMDTEHAFLCQECGHGFQITKGQLARERRDGGGGNPECPECGTRKTSHAVLCEECGGHLQTIGHGQIPDVCPHCDARLATTPDKPRESDDPEKQAQEGQDSKPQAPTTRPG